LKNNRFSSFIDLFTKLSTAIFLFSSLYILFFVGFNAVVPLRYVWGVLGVSAVLSLANILLFPERELPPAQFLLRTIGYALFCNVVVLGVGLWLRWFSLKAPATLIGLEITFAVVFAVVWGVMYLSTKRDTDKMNAQLQKLK